MSTPQAFTNLRGMRCVVFGGAGFIGSRLCAALLTPALRQLVIADNLCGPGSMWLIAPLLSDPRVSFVPLDVAEAGDFARLPAGPFDRVYHLAASFANELSERAPALDYQTNVVGTANVLRFAERAGVRHLTYAGSSSSYGAAPQPLVESGPMSPETAYARNKLAGEQLVRAAAVPWTIFRLFNVYGPGDYPGRFRNAIPNMMAAVKRGEALKLYGEGCTRDFNFIDDILGPLCAPEQAAGRVLNLSGGREVSIEALIEALRCAAGRPDHAVERAPMRSWDGVQRRTADMTALNQLYGALPHTPLASGLARTWAWFQAQDFGESATLTAAHWAPSSSPSSSSPSSSSPSSSSPPAAFVR